MIDFIINDKVKVYANIKNFTEEYGFSFENVLKLIKREYNKTKSYKRYRVIKFKYANIEFAAHPYNPSVQCACFGQNEDGYVSTNIVIFDKSRYKDVMKLAGETNKNITVLNYI